MESIRTSSLFHYSGTLENLKHIISDGFKPNFCKETFNIFEDVFCVGIPMVSFCDIPLTRSTTFKNRYKDYAIGLSKSWGLEKGLNPVLYVTKNSQVLSTISSIYERQAVSNENFTNRLKSDGRNDVDKGVKQWTIECHIDDAHDKISAMNEFLNSTCDRLTLFGYTKEYQGVGRDKRLQCNYEENEWRYILRENLSEDIIWQWNVDSYNKWRGDPKTKKPISNFAPLIFGIKDVNFIIVSKDYQIPKLITYINSLNRFGGNNNLTEFDRSILISKLISMESINKDF